RPARRRGRRVEPRPTTPARSALGGHPGAIARREQLGAGWGEDDLIACRADPDQGDRHADEVCDELQVLAGGSRQVLLAATPGEVLAPPWQLEVLPAGMMKHRLVVREMVELGSLRTAIPRADADPVEPGEDVELGHGHRRHRVEPGGVAKRDEV